MNSAAFRQLGDVRMADAAQVGGKAASLGELLAAGVRVPDGVVLTVGAASMTADDRRSLLRAGAAELGIGPFAVRSSGIAEDGARRSALGDAGPRATVDVAGRRARRNDQARLVPPLLVGRVNFVLKKMWDAFPRLIGAVSSDTGAGV
jgi:hypothetical protein